MSSAYRDEPDPKAGGMAQPIDPATDTSGPSLQPSNAEILAAARKALAALTRPARYIARSTGRVKHPARGADKARVAAAEAKRARKAAMHRG